MAANRFGVVGCERLERLFGGEHVVPSGSLRVLAPGGGQREVVGQRTQVVRVQRLDRLAHPPAPAHPGREPELVVERRPDQGVGEPVPADRRPGSGAGPTPPRRGPRPDRPHAAALHRREDRER